MSADEYEKRMRRRQQNRRAARKFREKKKVHAQGIIQVRAAPHVALAYLCNP